MVKTESPIPKYFDDNLGESIAAARDNHQMIFQRKHYDFIQSAGLAIAIIAVYLSALQLIIPFHSKKCPRECIASSIANYVEHNYPVFLLSPLLLAFIWFVWHQIRLGRVSPILMDYYYGVVRLAQAFTPLVAATIIGFVSLAVTPLALWLGLWLII